MDPPKLGPKDLFGASSLLHTDLPNGGAEYGDCHRIHDCATETNNPKS